MALSTKHAAQLTRIAQSIQAIVADAKSAPTSSKASSTSSTSTRTRRTGADLEAFKKTIKKERRAGASVAELAEKYGVTPSYLYQLRD